MSGNGHKAIQVIAIFTITAFFCERAIAQGLRFNGLEKTIEERTSVDIRGLRSRICDDSLCVAFDFKLFEEAQLGYIFQLKTGKSGKSPTINLFYEGDVGRSVMRVIYEGRRFITSVNLPGEGHRGMWMRLRMRLDPRKDSVYLKIEGVGEANGYLDLPDKIRPDLSFGKRKYILEVPSIAIKDLTVTTDAESISFPFNEDSGTRASSDIPLVFADISNPRWLANDYCHWRKEFQISSGSFLCAGYDTIRHQIYAINRDSITLDNIASKRTTTALMPGRCPVKITLGTSFVNPSDQKIYVYELYYRDNPGGNPSMASLNLDSLKWTSVTDSRISMQSHHHGEWLDVDSGQFLTFGGFGNSSYSGNFRKFDFQTKEWEESPVSGDGKLWPRFFQAMGYDHSSDRLYIFGGIGNENGDQFIGHQYFYDFHEVNPHTMESRLLWSVNWKGSNRVPARNMIIPGDGNFYVLFYPESLTESEVSLYRFSMKDGSFKELGDCFPIYSDRISANANLYYDKALQTLIATVEESQDDIRSKITAYTLSFPPKPLTTSTVFRRRVKRTMILTVSLLLVMSLVLFYLRKRRLNAIKRMTAKPEEPSEPKIDSILLFGPFKAFDHEGQDISSLFTGKLRLLFCLLLQAGESGLGSNEISFLLWPEKEGNESKNIRGVTINKLRKALSGIKGVSVEIAEGRYCLKSSEDFYCDLLAILNILGSKRPDINTLISSLSKGKFLSLETDPVLDGLKEDVEMKIEPVVMDEMLSLFKKKLFKGAIDCAEIIFCIDPFNDDALTYMVLSLRQLQMDSEARRRYMEFTSRYKKDYQEDYPRRYEEIRLLI